MNKPVKPQFMREFNFEQGTCTIKDAAGVVFLTVRTAELPPVVAAQMSLQHFVRIITEQSVEALRLRGLTEAEAKKNIVAAHARVLRGEYHPRLGRSPNGTRKKVNGVTKTAAAVFEAGYRSVTHLGETRTFATPEEAYLALQWLRKQPADTKGVTGRMVYLEITKHPDIRSRFKGRTLLARAALGMGGCHPQLLAVRLDSGTLHVDAPPV